MPPDRLTAWLDELSDNALASLPWLFDVWGLPHQQPPAGDWRTWVVLGGRGAGKTRAGAEWVRAQVEGPRPLDAGRARRVALVGETYDQVRDVMIEGDSGLLACTPPDRRPDWISTQRKLVWPNGAVAVVCSASDPEAMRGPQFDAAWVDELAKWRRAHDAWDMLQFCLRLGDDPRAVVTTTPRNVEVLRTLLAQDDTVTTQAPTEANRANLAPGFLSAVRRRFGGTRLGRQELDGVLVDEVPGAFWTAAGLDALRGTPPARFDRVVVGVDPAVTSQSGSDETGIVVVGVVQDGPPSDWTAWVLEDASVSGATPSQWAAAVADAYDRHGADRVVAEGNQGGDMIEAVLRQAAPSVSYRKVTARRGKSARAEPVAALYERGRVRHVAGLVPLEDQMCAMASSGYGGSGSPDRCDALVWALWAALLEPGRRGEPVIRRL
ncbi:DNA-packaging protein [Jannaschia sp. LMIT008]|uniref:DNA-packaging protein n=1 Tax=Jannaschia maritima TaxID=3032585 RepID=UPI002810FA6E|nr:terminase family protein [Jannaschia sp. LMIT008]